jgi:hypothetical protein
MEWQDKRKRKVEPSGNNGKNMIKSWLMGYLLTLNNIPESFGLDVIGNIEQWRKV